MLIAKRTGRHKRNPVAAIHNPMEPITDGFVNKVCKGWVSNARESEEICFVKPTVHTQSNVHGTKQPHCCPKRMSCDSDTGLILFLLELFHMLDTVSTSSV